MVSPPSDPVDRIRGQYYTGTDSRSRPARLILSGGRLLLETDSSGDSRTLDPEDVTISPRVGNTPRYLNLPGDGVFETTDNDRVDAMARQFRQGIGARLVHRLENHLGLIVVAAMVTTLVTVLTFTHGIPAAASLVAHAMPDQISRRMAEETLVQMDDFWLSPTTLSAQRQQELQEHFAPLLATEADHSFTVTFRDGDGIGANALALPDGTIIFTDQMVALAQHPDELSAVLAHEMGHVVSHHGMQGVVQSSLVGWVIVMMTGDLSAASDLVVVAPAVLMDLSYSRAMEREADSYALDLMLEQGLDPIHFSNLMLRLDDSHGDDALDAEEGNEDDGGWSERIGGALSTHPLTQERIERFQEASER